MSAHWLGSPVRVTVTARDVDGVTLVTPTTIVLTVVHPDGTSQNYPTPVADSLGVYHQDVPAADLTQVGQHRYYWTLTGPGAGVIPGRLDIQDPAAPAILTLADAKATLNIPAANSSYDTDLQLFVDAVIATVEQQVGVVVNRSVSEPTDLRDYYIRLRTRPIVSIQSLVSVADATAVYDVSQLYVQNPLAGLVRRKDGGPVLGGTGVPAGAWFSQYTATYTAGRGLSVPPAIGLAARIIVQHLWDTQRGPSARPTMGGDDLTTPGIYGFAVPNRAAELLAPFRLPTGYL